MVEENVKSKNLKSMPKTVVWPQKLIAKKMKKKVLWVSYF